MSRMNVMLNVWEYRAYVLTLSVDTFTIFLSIINKIYISCVKPDIGKFSLEEKKYVFKNVTNQLHSTFKIENRIIGCSFLTWCMLNRTRYTYPWRQSKTQLSPCKYVTIVLHVMVGQYGVLTKYIGIHTWLWFIWNT